MSAAAPRRGLVVSLAILGNALVQGLTVAPTVTASPSLVFAGLVVVSLVSVVALVAIVATTSRAWPRWPEWAAALAVSIAVALSGVVSPFLVPLAVAAAVVVLAGVAAGRPAAGFSAFRRHPVRAVLTVLGTLAVVGVLWLVALLLGFFVTGWLAAGLTWLVFGVTGAVLVRAWMPLTR